MFSQTATVMTACDATFERKLGLYSVNRLIASKNCRRFYVVSGPDLAGGRPGARAPWAPKSGPVL